MGIGAAILAFLGRFAPLKWFLEILLNSFGKAFNDYVEERRDDQAHRDAGAASATAGILVESIKIETEVDNAAARNARLARDRLLERLREHGHGDQSLPGGSNAGAEGRR